MAKYRANGEGSIRKRPDGRWEGRYYDFRESNPNKQRKSIMGKTQREVKDKLKAAISAMDESALITNNAMTVAEWLSMWMIEYRQNDLRDSTFESYMINIRKNINPHIGFVKLKELTGIHIQQLYSKLQSAIENGGSNLSASTIIKVKNILSGALQQAVINRLIRRNPIIETKPPKIEDPEIRILTKNEQKKFISVLPFYNTGNMFAVALATGMRIGELCALDVNDINREQKYIDITKSAGRRKDKYTSEVAIKVGPTKTKHSIRKIPLLPSVEVMFDRQAQLVSKLRKKAGEKWKENTLVFPTDEGNIHDLSGLRSSMGRILKRAGLPHMMIHALRHTYATTALNTGVAAQNVARLLGHKDGVTTLRFYAHYISTEAFTQLEKLEQQNISHLGITTGELQKIVMGTAEILEKASVAEQIDNAINKAKNLPPKKSVELVLRVCEDILCQPLDELPVAEKDVLFGVLAQYSFMKRQYAVQENLVKTKMVKNKGW